MKARQAAHLKKMLQRWKTESNLRILVQVLRFCRNQRLRLPVLLSKAIEANLWGQAIGDKDRQHVALVNIRQRRLYAVLNAMEADPNGSEEKHFAAAEAALEGTAAAGDYDVIKQTWQRYGRPWAKAEAEHLSQMTTKSLMVGDSCKKQCP